MGSSGSFFRASPVVLLLVVGGPARAATPSDTRAAKVEQEIRAALQANPDLRNNEIGVTVTDDVATLTGTVDSRNEKEQAVRLAAVPGIHVVDDQLKVGSAGVKAAVSDSGITADLKTRYLANSALRKSPISVETNNGVVTLTGIVPSEDAHRLAVEMARQTGGVKRVEDHLKVERM